MTLPRDHHRARAEAALQLSRWDEAAREAAQLIAADPGDTAGYAMLSRAHLGKSEFEKAQKIAEQGLAHAPESEWLHRLRCHTLRFQGKHHDALAAAETCVRLLPDAAESHGVHAKVLATLKRRDDAEAAYGRALSLSPEDADLHRELGDLFLEKAPAKAEECYRRALAIEPSNAVTLNNLGAALNRQKRPDEAAIAFKAAILADPTLKVAKENAHSTISSQLGKAAGVGTSIYILIQLVRVVNIGARQGALFGFLALAIAALIILGSITWRRRARRRRIEQLREKDPQLYAIFERLDADKKAGHL